MNFTKQQARHYKAQQMKLGYYLVNQDNKRQFISPRVDVQALEKISVKGDWWIDRYHGLDVDGGQVWDNLDHTGKFI
jgi:hypothetical protein